MCNEVMKVLHTDIEKTLKYHPKGVTKLWYEFINENSTMLENL